MTLANRDHSRKAARLPRLQICRVFDPQLNRVSRALFEQQLQNLRKGKSTAYRYTSELVLDFSFEVWFRGGMLLFAEV